MAAVDGNEPGGGENIPPANLNSTLMLDPNLGHEPANYDNLELDFGLEIYSSLEKYLPSNKLGLSRDEKAQYITRILHKYLPREERTRAKRYKEYVEKIRSSYVPLNKKLCKFNPAIFLEPSFLKAIKENTEESIKSISFELSPGVFVLKMFTPKFCNMMLYEVEHIGKWVRENNFEIRRPNALNNHGSVLDDFGLGSMLDELIKDFILRISKVCFPDVCGTLDSHHGYVVEYGEGRDADLGFHTDDSDVTLNVNLGKGEFKGGNLYFRGTRCEDHLNTATMLEERYTYCHVPGQAVLHRGSHRHGAKATTSSHRVNMILWCRSSLFKEVRKYQKDFSKWCGECSRLKEERRRQRLAATRNALGINIE